ncbi:CUG-BP- and ETR-3-like factor 3-B [Monoraphidium neglectum]|uniref:CUG-BP-and ETR-3-like factor 3-B n=1 Tax=Monoraphidium neglectum TaxID=145388 RepID=A0A0D2LMN9_9CHLO|nr:CUG-BP- and ETR-3-like factor 3-B [Monoraphidium neglectum]KIY91316.1 CUG-BP- and ETR-3-like factor 3-B [Monoraphidium neglectum]|eukprot:XP_013890336.1 CUG-BP- and ETR-3-like factor 3-B [Monoraphidium neglectum]
MGSVEEATAAIAALHEQHTWQGMAQPMVVRWMDSALQRRRREDHLSGRQAPAVTVPISGAFLTSFSAPSNLVGARGALPDARGPAAGAPVGLLAPHAHAHAHAHAAAPHPHPHALPLPHLSDASLYAPMPTEVPPPGCAPDAYKLFIGNVPSCYTERDLRPLFESIGPVVELVVLYDKQTGSSKGSAFCWYTTRADADRAAQHFNERHLLPDPTGHQQRPLVVRPATVRRSVPRALLGAGMAGAVAAGGGGALGGAGLHPQYGLQQPQQQQQRGAAAAAAPPGGIGRLMHPIMLGPGGSADSGVFNSGSFLVDSSAAFASAGHDGDLSALASGGYALGPGSGADSGGYAPLSSGAAPGGGGGAGAAGPGSAGNSTGAAGAGAWDAGGVGALGQLH